MAAVPNAELVADTLQYLRLSTEYNEAKGNQENCKDAIVHHYQFAMTTRNFTLAKYAGAACRVLTARYMADYPADILVLIMTDIVGHVSHVSGTSVVVPSGPIVSTDYAENAVYGALKKLPEDTKCQCTTCGSKLSMYGDDHSLPRLAGNNKAMNRVVFVGLVCDKHPMCNLTRDIKFGERFSSKYNVESSISHSLNSIPAH